MPTSGWWAHAVWAACVLAPAASAGTFEERRFQVVPYAGYTLFDEKRTFLTGEDVPGDAYFGGRASMRLSCAFVLEAAGGFSSGRTTYDWNDWGHLSGNLAWSPASGNQVTPFVSLGGGWSRTSHSDENAVDLGTIEGAIGVVVKVSNAVGVRLEARDVYSVSPDHWNDIVLGGGLSFAFGENRRCEGGPPTVSAFTPDEPAPVEPEPVAPPDEAPTLPPLLPQEIVQKGSLTVRDIPFAPGSADLEPASDRSLQQLCRLFRGHPELRIEIGAYTDAAGDANANLVLSERRAKAVYDWFVVNCLDVNIPRFTVRGYGEQGPIVSRRIVFRVLNPEVLRHER